MKRRAEEVGEGRVGSEEVISSPLISPDLLYCIDPHSSPDMTFIRPSPVLAVNEALMTSN
jgi:hypothetical protein